MSTCTSPTIEVDHVKDRKLNAKAIHESAGQNVSCFAQAHVQSGLLVEKLSKQLQGWKK